MPFKYDPVGSRCLGKAQPGLVALQREIMAQLPHVRNSGIYNCRNVVGGTGLSEHAEGRAWDAGFIGTCDPRGRTLANFFIKASSILGVQRIIWCRQAWGGSRGPRVFPYKGSNPHTDHVHVALNWSGARYVTRERVAAALDLLYP